MIVDEAEGRINYHLIEIMKNSYYKFTLKNGFQLFLNVLLSFAPEKGRSDWIVI